jgi:two-component system response regulator LytT
MQTLRPPVTHVTTQSKGILPVATGKTSFLVFKHNKYFMVPTESIAFFYVRYETTTMVCFDLQEYFVNYSWKISKA